MKIKTIYNMLLILDTSLLLSTLVSRGQNYGRDILKLAYNHKVQLAICNETFAEFQTKIKSDKIKNLITYTASKNASFVAWYKYTTKYFSINFSLPNHSIRDETDSMFIKLALISKANYIITLDKDLLVLKKIGNTKIIKPEEFITQEYNKS